VDCGWVIQSQYINATSVKTNSQNLDYDAQIWERLKITLKKY
jgi:hypothetical protein